jgi:uncharacterized protein with von Willebrand factor type A (vWA) domain
VKKVQSRFKSITDTLKAEKYSVKYDPFDLRNFRRIRDHNPRISTTYEEGKETYPPFEELQQDVFSALYKYAPEQLAASKMELAWLLNHQVMTAVLESPKYKELRILTRMDIINSTVGTEVLGEDVKNLVDELQKEFTKQLDKAQQAQAKVGQAEKDQANSAEPGGGDKDGNAKKKQALTLQQAKDVLKDSLESMKKPLDKKTERSINKMLDNAIQNTRDMSQVISNWGLEQDPTYSRMGYTEKVKLVHRLKTSEKLQKLALLAGRYKRLASIARHTKIKSGSDELYDTTLGDDLSRMLPNEFLKLIDPDLEMLFQKDFLEKRLQQYEYKGKTKKHKGPIVCCIDGSGSMGGPSEIWAKAVAISLLEIARSQHRNFFVIHFDATWDAGQLHTNSFLKSEPYNVREVIDLAEYFPGGGTLFEPPLDAAREKIMLDPGFSKADIIFITDGCSTVREDWLAEYKSWKQKSRISIYSVIIDTGYNTDIALEEFSDQIIPLRHLERHKDEAALEIFGLM